MATKYIIAKVRGCEIPIVFPDVANHNEVKIIVDGEEVPIVAAGVCSLRKDEVVAAGQSMTLNKSARDKDAEILDKLLAV